MFSELCTPHVEINGRNFIHLSVNHCNYFLSLLSALEINILLIVQIVVILENFKVSSKCLERFNDLWFTGSTPMGQRRQDRTLLQRHG